MHRFYADPDRPLPDGAFLTREDAHHALNVLRLRVGSPVEVIDHGMRFSASVASADGGDVILKKTGELPSGEMSFPVTLYQGIPKGDKMELIVQKATELGVSRIVPLIMSRCVVKLDEKDRERRRERWQKIAREAGKQSGRCVIPEVLSPMLLRNVPEIRPDQEELIVPWESAGHYGPRSYVRDHPRPHALGIVIGPEGGIDPSEIDELTALSARIITLGPRILRTETAGLAAVSALSALYGEME